MKKIRVSSKILIEGEDSSPGVFGPGVVRLLKAVEETGSLNKATKDMGMAYSKAWKMIGSCEEMLGFKLIDRLPGSQGSIVTEEAKKLIDLYYDLKKASRDACEKIINNFSLED